MLTSNRTYRQHEDGEGDQVHVGGGFQRGQWGEGYRARVQPGRHRSDGRQEPGQRVPARRGRPQQRHHRHRRRGEFRVWEFFKFFWFLC